MSISFKFPQNIQDFQIIKDAEDLKVKIHRQKIQNVQFKQLVGYYVHILSNGQNISAACKFCKSKLNYKKENSHYRLNRRQSEHTHFPKVKKNKLQTIAKKIMEQQSTGLPWSKQQIMKKFQCSRLIWHKLQNILKYGSDKTKKFQSLIKELSSKEYEIKFEPYDQNLTSYKFPEILIVISPQMKKQYQKYGKCLYLDTIHNICEDTPNFQIDQQIKAYNNDPNNQRKKLVRQFAITIIYGLNCFWKMVIFGFAIVLNQGVETTHKIVRTFFGFHNQIPTQTIISNGGVGIKKGISKLIEEGQFKGKHLTDYYHFIKKLKRIDVEIRELLSNICLVETNQEYTKLLSQVRSFVKLEQLRQIDEFEEKSSQFCFSKIPKTFVHSPSFSHSQMLCNIIKNHIQQPQDYTKLVRSLCQIVQITNKKSTSLDEENISFQQQDQGYEYMKTCRNNLARKVFEEVLKQAGKSQLNSVHLNSDSINSIFVVTKNSNPDEKFYVKRNEQDVLTCNCGYRQKTLLPCNHIISVALMQQIDIFKQIDGFYKQNVEALTQFRGIANTKMRNSNKSKRLGNRITRRSSLLK